MLEVADFLINSGSGKPKQIFLRRSYSTLYYAMFHALANCCSDMLIGRRGKSTSKHAWLETYRSLDHGFAKNQCKTKSIIEKFPTGIQEFATTFVNMQLKRHKADYDPTEKFSKYELELDWLDVQFAIFGLRVESLKDRRAFASFVLHKPKASGL